MRRYSREGGRRLMAADDPSQLQLDLGVPKVIQCSICKMVYNRTNPADIKNHDEYHHLRIRKGEATEISPRVHLLRNGSLVQRLREWLGVETGLFFAFGKRVVESILVLEEDGSRIILEYTFEKFRWKSGRRRIMDSA
jgi:hypothetical protein